MLLRYARIRQLKTTLEKVVIESKRCSKTMTCWIKTLQTSSIFQLSDEMKLTSDYTNI